MGTIDNDLATALHYNNNAWLKKIVGFSGICVKPEEEIGNRRCCDLLVGILKYDKNGEQKVAIEIENDRGFDAQTILRKIKKDQPHPTVVIIPQNESNNAWLFQDSMIRVWYWKAKIGWKCRKCNDSFQIASSITPSKCEKCNKAGQFDYEGAKPDDVEFVEDSNNPTVTFGEIQDRLGRGFVFMGG